MCNEGQMFDQSRMTCVPEYEVLSCQESSNFFYQNEYFGKE